MDYLVTVYRKNNDKFWGERGGRELYYPDEEG